MALMWCPMVSAAIQLSPNPNPSGSTITVAGFTTRENNQTYHNYGTIGVNYSGNLINYRRFNNYGRLEVAGAFDNASGLLYNQGSIAITLGSFSNTSYDAISNSGAITLGRKFFDGTLGWVIEEGTFYNHTHSRIYNGGSLGCDYGTFTNKGTIDNDLLIRNTDTFTNTGTINSNGSGTICSYGGTFANSGTIKNYGEFENDYWATSDTFGTFNNSGTFTNCASGTMKNGAPSTFTNAGTLNNHGTIENTGGTVENSGTLDNTGTIDNAGTLNNWGGTVNNSGTFDNTDWIWNVGQFDNSGTLNNTDMFYQSGTFTNTATGTVSNTGEFGNNVDHVTTNYGTFDNTGTLNNHGTVFNRGAMNNLAGGSIVNASRFDATGSLDNQGDIENTGTFYADGTINNAGTFDNRADGRLDIVGQVDNSSDLNNFGDIDHFGTLTNTSQIYNDQTGTIYAETGSLIKNDGAIQNNGTITNNGTFDSTAGTFENVGRYQGTGTFLGTLDSGAGTIAPGNSAGTMTVAGNFLLSDMGTLEIEIGGFDTGESDFLDISGSAFLVPGSTISFSFLDDYDILTDVPNYGDSLAWMFLEADEGIGAFLSSFSFDFLGTPTGFAYDVCQRGNALWFEATNHSVVPVPGAVVLAVLGLSSSGWRLRRKQRNHDQATLSRRA